MGVLLRMPGELLSLTAPTVVEPGYIVDLRAGLAGDGSAIGVAVTAPYNALTEQYEPGPIAVVPLRSGAVVLVKTDDGSIGEGDKIGVSNGKAVKFDSTSMTQVIGVALGAPENGYVEVLLI